jgi:hypothetical protein
MPSPEELEAWALEMVSGYEEQLVGELKERVVTSFARGGELTATDWDSVRKLAQDNRLELAGLVARYQPLIDAEVRRSIGALLRSFDEEEYAKALPSHAGISPVGSSARFEAVTQQMAEGVVGVVQRNNLAMTELANRTWLEVSAEAITRSQQGYPMHDILTTGVDRLRKLSGRVQYASGATYPIDAAIKRHATAQAAQARSKVTELRLTEMGHTVVATSAHWASREEHEPYQGRAYSLKQGGETWQGTYYPDLRSTGWPDPLTGMCTGINCRHMYFGYYGGEIPQAPGMTEGATNKQAYGLTQQQRALEVKVRNAKQKIASYEQAGLDTTYARTELGKAQRDLRGFVASNEKYGIQRAPYRERAYAIGTQPRALGIVRPSTSKPNISVPKSLGAKASPDRVRLPDGTFTALTEGSRITGIHVIAGAGTDTPIKDIKWLVDKHGGNAGEWEKAAGNGRVDDLGMSRPAHLHWYEAESVGRVEMRVKKFYY